MKQKKDMNKVHLINAFKRKIKTKPKKYIIVYLKHHLKITQISTYLMLQVCMCVTGSLKRKPARASNTFSSLNVFKAVVFLFAF